MSTNNKYICVVCGDQGVTQIDKNAFTVVMCPDHFNQLHLNLQEKKPRQALIKFHLAVVMRSHFVGFSDEEIELGFAGIVEERLNNWMDAEHEYFLVTEEIVEGMIRDYKPATKRKAS